MKPQKILLLVLLIFSQIFAGCAIFQAIGLYQPPPTLAEKMEAFKKDVAAARLNFEIPASAKVDTIKIDSVSKNVEIAFNHFFSHTAYRDENIQQVHHEIQRYFTGYLDSFALSVTTLHQPLEQLVPNYFRKDTSAYDRSRLPRKDIVRPAPVTANVSKPFTPTKGLRNRNIGLWNSHGWYYNNDLDRWEWQRPRLFLTVEDLIPTAFVLPYITPMLENAGAQVYLPRERDVQQHAVIVDNDNPETGYAEFPPKKNPWQTFSVPGFAIGNPPYGTGVNPFRQGTVRSTKTDSAATASIRWAPTVPEKGEYAVYISYASSDSSIPDARYTVYHLGGATEFRVNQQVGSGTWIYLGTFTFAGGKSDDSGSVLLTNQSAHGGKNVTADAVRFGGGTGVISRGGHASGRPLYVEGSRYYLQYAGVPDTLIYDLNHDSIDYNDDYQSRPEYLNYLTGSPRGPSRNRSNKGLGIPIDLSLAFHTDAGITDNDTVIGTLSIYSMTDQKDSTLFPDGVSRLANRDFADVLQTQIVNDIRAKYDPTWSRRSLRNADYSEATRPNMPSALLELLSHQNFLDMRFVLDPRFRFDASRAIYKGMLRFLATEYGTPYIIQPLPVTHFSAMLDSEGNAILRWKPQLDPIEPTAAPDRYIVYTRMNSGGFDNGVLVDLPEFMAKELTPGNIYSYKITAVNDGGESFPSEILSVCWQGTAVPHALIVNGFDRISGPASVDAPGFKGFLADLDHGVPDRIDLGFTGMQYDYEQTSPFRTNDAPGHGASLANNEGMIVAGNSFDYPFVHGDALRDCHFSFSSCSDEAMMDSLFVVKPFSLVDLILGKEKRTPWPKAAGDSINGIQFEAFPPELQQALQKYCESGGNLFISGSFVGQELLSNPKVDSNSARFAKSVLRMNWLTNHAARTGRVKSISDQFPPTGMTFTFNSELSKDFYIVESPDELVPGKEAVQILRYAENDFGAGVAYKESYGVVVFGFPFESIIDPAERTEVMKAVVSFLKVQ